MGKASSQKKVARAATTGGGRTAGVKRPIGWYGTLAVVVALGVFLVAFSRNQLQSASSTASKIPPIVNKDHWHSSFSVYLCDHWAPNIPLFESTDGLHTHGDGVIHLHPYSASVAGNNATLGNFVKAISEKGGHGKFTLSTTELGYPGDKKIWKNGDLCQGKPGKVKFTVNGKDQSIDPNSWKLRDGDYLNVGFVPEATPLPSNPAEKQNLANITDVKTSTGTTTAPATTAPGATPSTTVAGGSSTTAPATTSAPAAPSTTTK